MTKFREGGGGGSSRYNVLFSYCEDKNSSGVASVAVESPIIFENLRLSVDKTTVSLDDSAEIKCYVQKFSIPLKLNKKQSNNVSNKFYFRTKNHQSCCSCKNQWNIIYEWKFAGKMHFIFYWRTQKAASTLMNLIVNLKFPRVSNDFFSF